MPSEAPLYPASRRGPRAAYFSGGDGVIRPLRGQAHVLEVVWRGQPLEPAERIGRAYHWRGRVYRNTNEIMRDVMAEYGGVAVRRGPVVRR